MRRATFYLVLAVAILAVLLLAGCAGKQPERGRLSVSTAEPGPSTTETRQSFSSDWDLSPRRNDAGRVVIDIVPLSLSDDPWEFEVAFNTHSVDLGFDVAGVSVLRCDQGQEYAPTAWDGSSPGGHHRSGVLKFAALDHPTSSVEIVIRDVAGVPERVFHWDLPRRAESLPGDSAVRAAIP